MEKIMDNNIKETPKIRFAYLDNVRSLVIILVIAMHTAVTYSGLGGWYYIEGSSEKLSILEMIFFGFFQSFLQAWFMGILFFISAYFATKAIIKRRALNFIMERLFRLGLPLFIYIFIISPFIMFVLPGYYSESPFLENYIRYILKFWWLGSTGPLWFVQVLLFFCIIYAILKLLIFIPLRINNVKPVNIVFIIILTAIIAFLVRLVFPIGSSYLNLQFSYFPSYIVMFISGILLGENNLLENITDERNIKWLKLTFLIGIPLWAATMIFGGALEGKTYYNGGFHWQNITFALWESFTAISFSIGIIAFFKKNLNVENKFTRLMRDNAFGIYCFHAPILIAVSWTLKQFLLKPVLKFAIVFIFSSIFCLFFSFLIRKIKPIGILFK
jgi:surface polysaccharide O-acyltransferase-like enzyme